MEKTTQNSTPRDTFLYLLSIITLVATATSFGLAVYAFIDLHFPDVLQSGYNYATLNLGLVRGALATLIVVFPVFIWVSRLLHREVEAAPEKRNLRVRRWLLYLTVFVASLIVIGDLVTLIYNFLQGDLTTAFILKVLTIFFIAGSALWYYLGELQNRKYPRAAFQWTIVAVVAAVVIYGFFVVGSPAHQRLNRFDDQKITDLQTIQNQIVFTYWQQKGSLPTQLTQLNDSISGYIVPTDPQSGQGYEYRVLTPKSFELCAVFNDSSSARTPQVSAPVPLGSDGELSTNWQHGVGRACFDRTIDPLLYPTKTPIK